MSDIDFFQQYPNISDTDTEINRYQLIYAAVEHDTLSQICKASLAVIFRCGSIASSRVVETSKVLFLSPIFGRFFPGTDSFPISVLNADNIRLRDCNPLC